MTDLIQLAFILLKAPLCFSIIKNAPDTYRLLLIWVLQEVEHEERSYGQVVHLRGDSRSTGKGLEIRHVRK